MHLITVWTKYVDIVYMPNSLFTVMQAMNDEADKFDEQGIASSMKK